jgi:Rrf2 family protein
MDLSLTKRGEYAVRAAIALARSYPHGYLKTREIASDMDLPGRYAPQVLSLLGRAGLTVSKAGSAGGHRLSRPPAEISLLQIVNAAEGELNAAACMLTGGQCGSDDRCGLHYPWADAKEALLSALASTSLADVATDGVPLGSSPNTPSYA